MGGRQYTVTWSFFSLGPIESQICMRWVGPMAQPVIYTLVYVLVLTVRSVDVKLT